MITFIFPMNPIIWPILLLIGTLIIMAAFLYLMRP